MSFSFYGGFLTFENLCVVTGYEGESNNNRLLNAWDDGIWVAKEDQG